MRAVPARCGAVLMTSHPKSPVQGILLALGAFGVFATHDVAVKLLGGNYAVFQILFFSVLFGFPFVTVMLLRDPTHGTLRPNHPWWTGLRTAAAVVTGLTAFYAFSVLPLAQTYAILFASPLLITVLAVPVLGETVGWRRALAVCAGLIGVIIVLRPGSADLGLGHVAALVAAGCGALASVIVRKIGRNERSAVLILYPMVANFVIMGSAMPFFYRPMPLEDLGLVLVIAGFGFLGTLCLIGAYRRADAALVAPMQYSQILWASAYGWLFFSETIDTATFIGSAVIIASGLYIVLREARGGTSRQTPVLRTRSRAETGTLPRVSPMLRAQDKDRL
jgi:drug/metabolite transporter (DMT)-like permease